MNDYLIRILKEAGANRPVSLEVISTDEEGMFREARLLYDEYNSFTGNVVVKIPVNSALNQHDSNYQGLKVIRRLSKLNIPVNSTLIMNPEQAVLAAKAGARYVSPFVGRIDDYLRSRKQANFDKSDYFNKNGEGSHDNGVVSGVDLVDKIVKIFRNYNFSCEIIAASVRNPRQARELALTGVDIATIPFDVLSKMLFHEKTREGVEKFKADVVPEYTFIFNSDKK